MASGYAIAAGGTHVSTAENNKMKLGQKFAYEHGIRSKNTHPNIPD